MSTLLALESILNKKKKTLKDSLRNLESVRNEVRWQGDAEPFRRKVYPHAEEIFNLLNPLYVHGVNNFSKLVGNGYILLRDGFYPLVDFFNRFARPGMSDIILLVHEKLACVVPELWKNNILTYNIQRNFDNEGSRWLPETLYLCALTCDSDIRIETFHKKILGLKEFYGDRLSPKDIKFGILLREEPYYKNKKELLHESFPLVREIYSEFGLESNFCTWREVLSSKNFHRSCYYYVSEEYFGHAYSYIDHFFLGRRCMPFDGRFDSQKRGEMVFEVSPHYSIHVNQFHYSPNNFWPQVTKMINALGVESSLAHSEFFPYSWKLAEEYLFDEDKGKEGLSFRLRAAPLLNENMKRQ